MRQHHIAKQTKQKLAQDNVTIVKADKGKTIIIHVDEMKQKINNFLETNQSVEIKEDPTEKYQKTLWKTLNQSEQIVHTSKIATLIPQKPTAPKLQVRLITHKEQYPIRPVVNNINAPSY
jgi:hypothetical protein